jgi:hypothetical protein
LEHARRAAAALDPERALFELFVRDRTTRVVAMPLLLGVNIAIYFVMLVTSRGRFDVNTLLRWGALYGPLVEAGEWWRALTAAFVHVGFWHLFANMMGLLFFGRLVERIVGPTRLRPRTCASDSDKAAGVVCCSDGRTVRQIEGGPHARSHSHYVLAENAIELPIEHRVEGPPIRRSVSLVRCGTSICANLEEARGGDRD